MRTAGIAGFDGEAEIGRFRRHVGEHAVVGDFENVAAGFAHHRAMRPSSPGRSSILTTSERMLRRREHRLKKGSSHESFSYKAGLGATKKLLPNLVV